MPAREFIMTGNGVGMDAEWEWCQRSWTARLGRRKNFEIGRVQHLKSEIRNHKLDGHVVGRCKIQSEISDFGFEMLDSSNFEFFCHSKPKSPQQLMDARGGHRHGGRNGLRCAGTRARPTA